MALRNIPGNESQKRQLLRRIADGTLPHANLFCGPIAVAEGAARSVAQILNCEAPQQDACGACAVCVRIENGAFPDCAVIRPGGASRTIKIEEIRDLQKKLSLSRFEGRAKVAVIAEAHALNPEASNALLKILEEPSSHTFFFLATDNSEGLLATIRSRCQALVFEAQAPPPAPRPCVEQWIRFLLAERPSAAAALEMAGLLAKESEEDKTVLEETLKAGEEICRDLLAAKTAGAPLLRPALKEALVKKGAAVSTEELLRRIELAERLRGAFHRHIPAKFALDTLCLSFADKIRMGAAS